MKAILMKNFGIENTELIEFNEEGVENEIKIRTKIAGLNPLDYNVINGKVVYGLNPMPHIPGSEIFGIVDEDGKNFKKGERVIIYNRIFDETCTNCISGNEYLCESGGIYGVVTNGGFREIIYLDPKYLFRVPETISDYVAASLPIGGLTSYHALNKADAKAGETMLVFGASGNTGIFLTQLGHMMGLEVIAVSSKDKNQIYGADQVYSIGEIPKNLKADIIFNSLGGEIFKESFKYAKTGSRIVTYGVLNGRITEIDVASVYTKELKLIGSTGGSRKDLEELIKIASKNVFKVNVEATYNFLEYKKAFQHFERRKTGRILLTF
ncbi:alcohol dehydrogenase catalytic domain-containing protein [Caldiplasma sukawensis]